MSTQDTTATRAYIVTGGGSGIGAAAAALLRERGHAVVIGGRRRDVLDRVAGATGALAVPGDAAEPADVAALIDAALDAYGRVDGLVLNAGIMRQGNVLDTDDADWDATLRTNLTGPFLLARAALPHLIESAASGGGGAIVSVSSVAGLRSPTGAAAYAASKAALIALTGSIAADFGPRGVRANTVCPGWMRTEMADEEMDLFSEGGDREAAYREITQLVPSRRAGTPREAAEAIAWLLSPAASYVNGAVLTVDGGTVITDPGTAAFEFAITPR